ncbi:ABC transporter ATP-binding protein [Aneurinibacillus migulanus]|uniref:ABC-2 type transport system ATP-binding protein n=1 Tax=Aneurinibacillus migulanus TaxID=47500 RepID=A0A1G9BDC7_ANEMI|nr:ABC transporter ATP-binding protein [Aneurinibacillus migulanus]MED0894050.1 ABC transporter ATP-binding protein [Aneurinibacillus migulanus]MED1619224.1 ABC transporter ATP-binding protein [Aneurinibacillus migulanus]GED18066.1 ABC transporter ATP-binding protein [Aneurinibacillus migulanus]SDK37120.1 ABC-2 type transport system ATP-binding protein [Aneurinibacillus migulanus]
MIRIENLSKSFGKTRVLQQLSLNVNEGVFGILGNNGAGKTTLLKILATVLSFEQGTVTVFGIDVKKEAHEIRKRLGYLPQDFNFFPNMSLDFAMHYFADLKGMPKGKQRQSEIDDWLDQVNLLPHRKKLIKQLSGGMKQRLGIAQALLGNPKLLIVDEPTVGLDPDERIRFRHLLGKFSQGRIILLSTHIVSDIASTCHNIAIIRAGRTFFQGPVDELLKLADGKVWEIELPLDQIERLSEQVKIVTIIRRIGSVHARFLSNEPVVGFEAARLCAPTLEDAYLYVNGQGEIK